MSQAPRILAIAVLLATASVGVTGCSLISGIVNEASGGAVDIGGASLPEGFPAEVPLAGGEVINGSSVGTEPSESIYNITIKSDAADAPAALTEATTALEDAGFETSDLVDGAAVDASAAGYANGTWGVLVVATGDAGEDIILNYTVTPVTQ
jgi:hypothetical protein